MYNRQRDKIMVNKNIYSSTKELFKLYLEIIQNQDKYKNYDIKEIVKKIINGMNNLISTISYIENLMDIFLDIRYNYKNIYYEIFVNYMKLLNDFGIQIEENKLYKNYNVNLYLIKSYNSNKKYIIKTDLDIIDKEIKEEYEKELNRAYQYLKKNIFIINNEIGNNEEILLVLLSNDQSVNCSFTVNINESFQKVEELLCAKYPHLIKDKNYFVCNGNIINKDESFKNNNLVNGSVIVLCNISDSMCSSYNK